MHSTNPATVATREVGIEPIHPVWMRLTHWLNALAVPVLVASGWRIYNAAPFFSFEVPGRVTLGAGLASRCNGTSQPYGCWLSIA